MEELRSGGLGGGGDRGGAGDGGGGARRTAPGGVGGADSSPAPAPAPGLSLSLRHTFVPSFTTASSAIHDKKEGGGRRRSSAGSRGARSKAGVVKAVGVTALKLTADCQVGLITHPTPPLHQRKPPYPPPRQLLAIGTSDGCVTVVDLCMSASQVVVLVQDQLHSAPITCLLWHDDKAGEVATALRLGSAVCGVDGGTAPAAAAPPTWGADGGAATPPPARATGTTPPLAAAAGTTPPPTAAAFPTPPAAPALEDGGGGSEARLKLRLFCGDARGRVTETRYSVEYGEDQAPGDHDTVDATTVAPGDLAYHSRVVCDDDTAIVQLDVDVVRLSEDRLGNHNATTGRQSFGAQGWGPDGCLAYALAVSSKARCALFYVPLDDAGSVPLEAQVSESNPTPASALNGAAGGVYSAQVLTPTRVVPSF